MSEVIKWSELSTVERDKLIAEKAMGLKVHVDMWGFATVDKGEHKEALVSYSTDMNHAMSALLHLGRRFTIEYNPNPMEDWDRFTCGIEPLTPDGPGAGAGVSGDLVEALNLAVLIACDVWVEP